MKYIGKSDAYFASNIPVALEARAPKPKKIAPFKPAALPRSLLSILKTFDDAIGQISPVESPIRENEENVKNMFLENKI